MLQVDARWGVAALTAASGVAAWVEFALLRRALARRVGRTGVRARRMAALWFLAAISGILTVAATRVVGERSALLVAIVATGIFGATYLALTRLARVDDGRRA